MGNKKVWLVTGASQGLGLTLVNKLLSQGYAVAATSRNKSSLEKAISEANENFLPLTVDLVDEKSVQNAIAETLSYFGKIDVLVNNAGYGHFGTLEELSDKEVRQNFDANVFGSLNVIRNLMPHLRTQQSGHIFNIASIGGYSGNFAGWGIYCSTKFAMAGFTEALAEEGKPFGIHTTLVYPGYFRTNFLASSSMVTPANPIAAYESARESQRLHQDEINGNQPGDPEKLAEALIETTKDVQPPVHLFLGQDAYNVAYAKMDIVKKDLEAFKNRTVSTQFEEVMA